MARYHLNPDTGIPGRCTAMVNCPFGDLERDHYDSREEAFEAYEQRMKDQAVPESQSASKTGDDYTPGNIKVSELEEDLWVNDGVLLPAGRYWIGDPCYSAGKDDDAWQEWVNVAGESSNEFKDPVSGANYNDYPVVGVSTAYGDGFYEDQNGVGYPVDAGMIGAVPAELLEKMNIDKAPLDGLGSWIDAAEPLSVTREGSGTILFGDLIRIETDDETEREDY